MTDFDGNLPITDGAIDSSFMKPKLGLDKNIS
jgi:hypothetical protein